MLHLQLWNYNLSNVLLLSTFLFNTDITFFVIANKIRYFINKLGLLLVNFVGFFFPLKIAVLGPTSFFMALGLKRLGIADVDRCW